MALGIPDEVSISSPALVRSNSHSVPAGAFGWLLLYFVLPAHFPNPAPVANEESTPAQVWVNMKTAIHQVDFFGAFLVLTACSFIIAALQEGNYQYSWSSALVISFLVISGIAWIAFIVWQWFICRRDLKISPMFPWRLAHNRLFMGMALFVPPVSVVSNDLG